MSAAPAIVGTGFAVPPQVRLNTDPIFAALASDQALFTGYEERRVLGPGETVTWLMVSAARAALVAAALEPEGVDLLLGYASVSEYITPNSLAEVHHELGLPDSVPVLPLADDYTNFNSGLVVADALIRTGGVRNALIVCGDNWTQYVNYTTPQSISAGDGAGAAVVAPATSGSQWTLADRAQLTASQDYGVMYMDSDPAGDGLFTAPWFHLTPDGAQVFGAFGGKTALGVVTTLMERHGLTVKDVTVISHQTSQTLYDMWDEDVPGLQFLSTLKQYANVVLSAIPLTLAAIGDKIKTDNLILFGLGPQVQAGAVLLTRQPSAAATSSALADAPHAA